MQIFSFVNSVRTVNVDVHYRDAKLRRVLNKHVIMVAHHVGLHFLNNQPKKFSNIEHWNHAVS